MNRVRLMKLTAALLDGAMRPKRASWLEELIRGPRQVLSLSFNDVRNPALFPLYLENRARAISSRASRRRCSCGSRTPKRLRIDEIYPGARRARADRRESRAARRSRSSLDTSEGVVPQTLSVQFGYTTRLPGLGPDPHPAGLLRARSR